MASSPLSVFDGHNDTLLDIHTRTGDRNRSFFVESSKGHIDLPRARRGGLAGGFFALFVPPLEMALHDRDTPPPDPPPPMPPMDPAHARAFTEELIDSLFAIERDGAGQVKVVRNSSELDDCVERGVLAMILHFEGAEAIHPHLGVLEEFYEKGLRSIGIVWSRPNAYGHGVPFDFPGSPDVGPGLTELGTELVRECNRLGVMIDLSHLNEQGFWDVARVSDAPLVATHASVHSLCPSPRNLTDAQLDAIGESGGVVGVNFAVGFLRGDGQRNDDTPLAVLVQHIGYVAERIGIEHVALGSDFDGAMMPSELGDVTGLPKLVEGLRGAGYGDEALALVTHQNWLRVLRTTWK